MARLTAVERQEKADRAVELSARGWTNVEIAEEISVNRNTVRKLISDELASRAEHREGDKERAIAVYTEVIREGWYRLRTIKDGSLNVSGVLNSVVRAQNSINKITGAEAPQKKDITLRDGSDRSATEREADELDREILELERAVAASEAEEGEG